jgi:hypothetical protein
VSKIILIIVPILLFLIGCEEKTTKDTAVHTAKTSEIFTKKDISTRIRRKDATHFTLNNAENESISLYVSKNWLSFETDYAPISLVTVFAKENSVHLSTINQLQERYNTLLFMLNIAKTTNDTATYVPEDDAFFSTFNNAILTDTQADLLTVLYADGKYITHYEGLIPIEMIQYDIEQAQKNIP